MSRSEKLAWGLGAILVLIILWLLLRSMKPVGGGNIKLGDIFFGGVDPASINVTVPPYVANLDLDFTPPAEYTTTIQGESPCACGCESLNVDFLDMSGLAEAINEGIQVDFAAKLANFFSSNPISLAYANMNKIPLFQYGYDG